MRKIDVKIGLEIDRVTGKDSGIRDMVSGVYVTEDGKYVLFFRPKIHTSFCYGYGHRSGSADDGEGIAEEKRGEAETRDGFMRENIRREFKDFEGIVGNPGIRCQSWNSNLFSLCVAGDAASERLSERDAEGLRKAFCAELSKFMKRLDSYWKRYGPSKLRTWSYQMD